MNGPKMEQAKGALRYCLRSLGAADRFAVVDFATEVRAWRGSLVDASAENVAGAVAYVGAMKARGGTAIHEALLEALKLGGAPGRPFMVVFLTDGEPTIGLTVPAEIEKAVRAARESRPDAADVRLFVFGIGADLNAPLLDRLAEQNRGAREYVADHESVEVKVSRFFDKVAAPVLSDVKVAIDGMELFDVYPRPVPDLFRGGEVAIVGRFRAAASSGVSGVRVIGKIGGRPVEIAAPYRETISASASFLPRLHAVRKVGFLLDQVRLHGETDEVRKEIVRLAKEHGIVTPYTSYLVVEDERMVSQARPGGARHAAADAIEGLMRGADDGLRRLQGEAERAMDLARAARKSPGPAGVPAAPPAPSSAEDKERQVAASEEARALQEASAAAAASGGGEQLAKAAEGYGRFRGGAVGGGFGKRGEPSLASPEEAERRVQEVLRVVEGRTFYRQGEAWVDAKVAPERKATRRVAYLSPEYWKLVAERPALGKFLSLGAQVRIADGADLVEVYEEAEEPEAPEKG
jgi:Ca-activated chloride channel family protein